MRYFAKNKEVLGYDNTQNDLIEKAINEGYIEIQADEIENYIYTEEEREQREQERIANLRLTRREVFLALYRDKGITPDQIRAGLTNEEAIIEFDYASDYYRGNPLIAMVGASLGYTSSELDYLFEHKEFPNNEEVDNG